MLILISVYEYIFSGYVYFMLDYFLSLNFDWYKCLIWRFPVRPQTPPQHQQQQSPVSQIVQPLPTGTTQINHQSPPNQHPVQVQIQQPFTGQPHHCDRLLDNFNRQQSPNMVRERLMNNIQNRKQRMRQVEETSNLMWNSGHVPPVLNHGNPILYNQNQQMPQRYKSPCLIVQFSTHCKKIE